MKKIALAAALAATTVFAGTLPAMAEYPTSPVQFIVPFPPGDFEDITTRMFAAKLQEITGVSASVVNRPGGGDGPFPGALEVLNGPTDGSVIGSFVIGVPVVGPLIGIGIEEDSFTPIGVYLTYPFVLATAGDAPYSNMSELAAHAKDNDVVLGHFGAGLAPTKATFAGAALMDFEFADDAAFDMLDCNSLSSGDADVINTTLALIEPCLDDITILANIGEERIGKLPEVATLAEQSGAPELELWNGLFVKKGTPQEVIDVIADIAQQVIASDEGQQLMAETGARLYWEGTAEATARIEADRVNIAIMNELIGD
ncbi:MAG: tripartite tricarboxylate transporter substrate binding protein [Marinovum sp.]|jgi:tripartite-type tricarboxylate transporter receptor subunit TctC|nr:tripartite tricarboxylate transporter substrate binding protein [Marinovum sp.]MBT6532539.1 tripartite tricarboxylate transporter substrate binding protein [Marinovum sp.]